MTQTLKIGLPVKKKKKQVDGAEVKIKTAKSAFSEVLKSVGLGVKDAAEVVPYTSMIFGEQKPFANEIHLDPQIDILRNVQDGITDVGIIGEDKYEQFQASAESSDNIVLCDRFAAAACRLVLAAPDMGENVKVTPSFFNRMAIATSYPDILRAWLNSNNITNNKILQREGGVEDYVRRGSADAILDITETGSALREYGLKEYFEVTKSSAVLIASKSMAENLRPSFETFKGQLTRSVVEDAPVAALA